MFWKAFAGLVKGKLRSCALKTNRVRSLLTMFSSGVKAAMAWCPSLVTESSPVDRRMVELHRSTLSKKICQDTRTKDPNFGVRP